MNRERQAEIAAEYDWSPAEEAAENKAAEMREMWEEYEGDYQFKDWLNSTFRGEPLPDDLRRYLRNDGVADWYEICVLDD